MKPLMFTNLIILFIFLSNLANSQDLTKSIFFQSQFDTNVAKQKDSGLNKDEKTKNSFEQSNEKNPNLNKDEKTKNSFEQSNEKNPNLNKDEKTKNSFEQSNKKNPNLNKDEKTKNSFEQSNEKNPNLNKDEKTKNSFEQNKDSSITTKIINSNFNNTNYFLVGYTIYDAWRTLVTDNDGDGYYSTYKIKFDADVSGTTSPKSVYAKLYIRLDGSTTWNLYYTTPNFTITGASSDDWIEVTTTLNTGYPAGLYDIRIQLYEAGTTTIVASRDASSDNDLNNLPLESADNDVPINIVYTIYDAWRTLVTDNDGDGYYSTYKIKFDADVSGTTMIYESNFMKPEQRP